MALLISETLLAPAFVGVLYEETVSSDGAFGEGTYTWTINGLAELPEDSPNLGNPSFTGLIRGLNWSTTQGALTIFGTPSGEEFVAIDLNNQAVYPRIEHQLDIRLVFNGEIIQATSVFNTLGLNRVVDRSSAQFLIDQYIDFDGLIPEERLRQAIDGIVSDSEFPTPQESTIVAQLTNRIQEVVLRCDQDGVLRDYFSIK